MANDAKKKKVFFCNFFEDNFFSNGIKWAYKISYGSPVVTRGTPLYL